MKASFFRDFIASNKCFRASLSAPRRRRLSGSWALPRYGAFTNVAFDEVARQSRSRQIERQWRFCNLTFDRHRRIRALGRHVSSQEHPVYIYESMHSRALHIAIHETRHKATPHVKS